MLALWSPTVEAAPRSCLPPHRGYGRPVLPGRVALESEVRPLIVWYDPAHENSARIAPRVLAAAERAWRVQFDEIGFLPPALPDAEDGPEFDIYLVDYQRRAAYVAGDFEVDDARVGDGYNSQSSYMVVDRELPSRLVDGYLAHELNHASQWAYDYTERSLPLWEGTATAAERWTLGRDYDWGAPLPSFQEVPFAPALFGTGARLQRYVGRGDLYEYGAALWVVWLDEQYGDGSGSAAVALWEALSNEGFELEPDVVDALGEVTGLDPLEALAEMAVARWLTGLEHDERGLQGAGEWGPDRAVLAERLTGADLPVARAPRLAPLITGQSFLALDLADDGRDDTLEVVVGSPSGLRTGLTVLWWRRDGRAGHVVEVGDRPRVVLDGRGLARIVVAITNGGPPAWDGDDQVWEAGDQRLVVRWAPRGGGCATLPGGLPAGALLGWGALALVLARRRAARPRTDLR